MGKSLIIKGADFSENAINPNVEWYNEYENLQGGTSTGKNLAICPRLLALSELNLTGKSVDMVRFYSSRNAVIQIGPAVISEENDDPIVFNEGTLRDYQVTEGINTILLHDTITFSGNTSICFSEHDSTGSSLTYNTSLGIGWAAVMKKYATGDITFLTVKVPIEFGLRDEI